MRHGLSNLAELPIGLGYRSGEASPLRDFLVPCLEVARSYDRAVGYFRTSVLPLIGVELVNLATRGGAIRVVCSPDLSAEDVEAIATSQDVAKSLIGATLRLNIESLLNERGEARVAVRVLATLLAFEALDMRIAYRPGASGIYHEKLGLIHDFEGNTVSFLGSPNETGPAWAEDANFESIEVFRSWKTEPESERVTRHEEYFERLWASEVPRVRVINLDEETTALLLRHSYDSLDASAERFAAALGQVQRRKRNLTPRLHQKAAIDSWLKSGSRGIFEHATGSGKTISALLAMEPHLSEGKAVLVLVPSNLLAEQWLGEVREFYPKATVLHADMLRDKSTRVKRLRAMAHSSAVNGKQRIIISTLQSASRSWFLDAVIDARTLMVVADEVHRTGSQVYRRVFQVDAEKRLGLSATPQRFGDIEGTKAILDYFGPILEPIFGIREAIQTRALVPYRYFVHFTDLTDAEDEVYSRLSKEISIISARVNQETGADQAKLRERIKQALIRRARVVKRAEAKTKLAAKIVADGFLEGQRWLVYCDDREQLAEVVAACRARGMPTFEYHFASELPEETMTAWASGGGVMVAIRCLDEGVNIPAVSHAVILASSRNPREFIQRRGRVLRPYSGKSHAVIHDVLVVPVATVAGSYDALAASEAARALLFAESAMNVDATVHVRARLATHNPYVLESLLGHGEETDE